MSGHYYGGYRTPYFDGGQGGSGWDYSLNNPHPYDHLFSGRGLAHSYANTLAQKEKDENTATTGAVGFSAVALATGKLTGLSSIGTGAAGILGLGASSIAAPLMGLAIVAGAGALGALAITKGTPSLVRGLGKVGDVAAKTISHHFENKSYQAIEKNHKTYDEKSVTKSRELDEKSVKIKEREDKFSDIIKQARKNLDKGDLQISRNDIANLYRLKLPSQQSRKELRAFSADYILQNSLVKTQDNQGAITKKLDMKTVEKNFSKLANDTKLSKWEKDDLSAALKNRIEEKIDDLEIYTDKHLRAGVMAPKNSNVADNKTTQALSGDNKKEDVKQSSDSKANDINVKQNRKSKMNFTEIAPNKREADEIYKKSKEVTDKYYQGLEKMGIKIDPSQRKRLDPDCKPLKEDLLSSKEKLKEQVKKPQISKGNLGK